MLNKNAIPNDPQPPSIASGIRVGTPSVTTQGMDEADMKQVRVTDRPSRQGRGRLATATVAAEVAELVAGNPAYAEA